MFKIITFVSVLSKRTVLLLNGFLYWDVCLNQFYKLLLFCWKLISTNVGLWHVTRFAQFVYSQSVQLTALGLKHLPFVFTFNIDPTQCPVAHSKHQAAVSRPHISNFTVLLDLVHFTAQTDSYHRWTFRIYIGGGGGGGLFLYLERLGIHI